MQIYWDFSRTANLTFRKDLWNDTGSKISRFFAVFLFFDSISTIFGIYRLPYFSQFHSWKFVKMNPPEI